MDNCLNPQIIHIKEKYSKGRTIRPSSKQVVPCGKCLLCLHSKRMNWVMRIEQETKYSQYPNHYFLTLTYNEKKVPRKKGLRTLYKRHPTLFFKRLRKTGHKIKYILVGEYGGKTSRPHYHLICWTTAPPSTIDLCWNYGFVHYRKLAKESILYTLKYIINPRQGDNDNKQKEYAVFSKGLGLAYLTNEMYNYHTEDYANPIFFTVLHERKIPLPRYYRRKIFTKYQCSVYAETMYYQTLREKMRVIKHFKELRYQNPWKAQSDLKHNRAREIKIKHQEKYDKL